MENEGPKKGKSGQRTDEEVLEILRKAAEKTEQTDTSGPALSEEALKAVEENKKRDGKVWEESPDDSSPEQ